MDAKPTLNQWKKLYEAAEEYKKAAIWRWLSNAHVFVVRNPADGKIGYCCVFGGGREMFGLSVYLGTEGVRQLMDLFDGVLAEDPMFAQRCLIFSLDSREDLHPSERKRIKELGLRYRGANAWPSFREHEPGLMPWPDLTAEQVEYLALALHQACLVGEQYRDNPDSLLEGEGERFLVREPDASESGGDDWRSVWLEPEEEPSENSSDVGVPQLDEFRIARALKGIKGQAGIWETDSFYVAMPIQEGGRPFYPKMTLIVDQSSGQILKFSLNRSEEAAEVANEHLLTLIEELQLLPKELWVGNESTGDALLPLAEALKTEMMFSPVLPALSEAREAMERRFM